MVDTNVDYIFILIKEGNREKGIAPLRAVISAEDKDLCAMSWTAHISGKNTYACHRQFVGGNNYSRVFLHTEIIERMIKRPLDKNNKSELADHINRNTLDCRRSNLRLSNRSLNALNTSFKKEFRGVALTDSGRFRSYIQKEGQQFHLGTFDTEHEAALAYNDKATELFGEFARLNDVTDEL